jgi:hypothetical protein
VTIARVDIAPQRWNSDRMRSLRGVALLASAAVLVLAHAASAHAPGAVLYGTGTATVDGSLGADEWTGARRLPFAAALPAFDGGGTVPGTLLAMNDGANLYFALEVGRATYGGSTSLAVYFDNDHSATREAGDDAFLADVGLFSDVRFIDWHWAPCTPGGLGVACPVLDVERGGSSEGAAAAGIGPGGAVLEVWHPLDSADNAHDFSLRAGSVAGFSVAVRLFATSPAACNFGPSCYADTFLPVGIPDHGATSSYGNLVIAPDTAPPQLSIAGGPADGSRTRAATVAFRLEADDNLTPADRVALACSIDGRAYAPCGTSLSIGPLTSGIHRLSVRASDELGNTSTSEARSWRVDRTPPSRPVIAVSLRGRRAAIRLSSRDPDDAAGTLRFRCALDRAPVRPCAASFSRTLAAGRHTVRAYAEDTVGNRSPVATIGFSIPTR